ncbi:amino acid--tRNA ligase-related protein, partial [Nanoarchaeota archaeon]
MINIEPVLEWMGPYVSYFQNPWAQAGVVLVGFVVVAFILFLILEKIILKLTLKTKTNVDDLIISKTKKPVFWLLIVLGLRISAQIVFDQPIVFRILESIVVIIFVLILSKIINILIDGWGHMFAKKTKTQMDESLLPLFKKVVNIVLVVAGILWVLNTWNINITPYLAGLGIGGLVLGLALQDSLKNIFGGVSLILDKTYAVGDKIRIESGDVGEIVDVGLRSTKVKTRPENQIKKEMATGEIEVAADSIEVLSEAEELPLDLNLESTEETRLKYRYLDLRTPRMQKNLALRHKVTNSIREFMNEQGFLDIETPFLAKSTPEGARDYLVPARNFSGKFFALPQSPQLFKQLLMISNFDKYYQIVKCFRDEDLRADRQPEFTQLDIEMSFVEEEDIYSLVEGLMKKVFKDVLNYNLKVPFPRMTHAEAIKKYKSDKPNLAKGAGEFLPLWVTD